MEAGFERQAPPSGRAGPRRSGALSVGLARTEPERRAAQRLRWKVFADEMGARLPSREPGIDHDAFDPFCDHLVARERETGEIVGTYRILPPAAADLIGCYYSETEFDLGRLAPLRDGMVEVGRSCVHLQYRTGAVIAQLWAGLARYVLERGHSYLAGCASVSIADGGHAAAALYAGLPGPQRAPAEYSVTPRCRLPLERLNAATPVAMPALLKGYLRCGAFVCGEPAWDPDFNTADFFVLLPVSRLEARYARHFFGHGTAN